MKKKYKTFILLLICLFLVSGCTRLDNTTMDDMVNNYFYKTNLKPNKSFGGYRFYLPRDVIIIKQDGYNFELRNKDSNFYLYVDIVSKHYKRKLNFSPSLNNYYYKELKDKKNNSLGFIEIRQEEAKKDSYYYIIVYNYSRIEGYTNKKNLQSNIANSSSILSSMKYNDNVIKVLMGRENVDKETIEYKLYQNINNYQYISVKENIKDQAQKKDIRDFGEERIKK